jgi:hypothetical protein
MHDRVVSSLRIPGPVSPDHDRRACHGSAVRGMHAQRGSLNGEAIMRVNQDDRNGFRFGLETEYLLVDAGSFRPLWYPDLSFERLNLALAVC